MITVKWGFARDGLSERRRQQIKKISRARRSEFDFPPKLLVLKVNSNEMRREAPLGDLVTKVQRMVSEKRILDSCLVRNDRDNQGRFFLRRRLFLRQNDRDNQGMDPGLPHRRDDDRSNQSKMSRHRHRHRRLCRHDRNLSYHPTILPLLHSPTLSSSKYSNPPSQLSSSTSRQPDSNSMEPSSYSYSQRIGTIHESIRTK